MSMENLSYQLLQGHSIDILKTIPDNVVQCTVTSPPYYMLREYDAKPVKWADGWKGNLGREKSPEIFVEHLTQIFEEVRRVTRDDGILWLNIGDTSVKKPMGKYKKKDLIGIPWMVAFALRDAGWYLRMDVIWEKTSPMPDGATDRPTRGHEYIFLFSKSEDYFYDLDAIAEPIKDPGKKRAFSKPGNTDRNDTGALYDPTGRFTKNKRSVWSLSHEGYSGAHFAVMPTKMAELCIKAGTPLIGCCPDCRKPWKRIVDTRRVATRPAKKSKVKGKKAATTGNRDPKRHIKEKTSERWATQCKCKEGDKVPSIVLDPFSGSGTTGYSAMKLGRNYLGIELSEEYLEQSRRRLSPITDGMFVSEEELY